jgi:acyl-CoA synthetase (AMP-forming)/AMP-acid ligase II
MIDDTNASNLGRPLFLRARADHAPALVTSNGLLSVGDILKAARRVSVRIRAAANRLGRTRRTDTLCLLLPSSDPSFFTVGLLACSLSGVTVVPWREKALQLDCVSETVRPDGVLQPQGALDDAEVVGLDGPKLAGRRRGELVMMTSGSTGEPKGVALDFAQVVLNATSAGSALGLWRCSAWAIDLDMALMSALCHLLMAWQFDLPLVHLKGIAPTDTCLALDEDFGFGGSPLQLVRLHEAIAGSLAPRLVVSSGDFLRPAMIDAIAERYPGTEIHKFYGLTELGGRFCHMPAHELMRNKDAVGRPLPGLRARITAADRDGHGEVEARSPLVAAGYYLPGGKFETIETDWFATGDVGAIDKDGVITLLGRSDDVFKVGGEKVDRATIESALVGLLKERSYCVLPIEHDVLGLCSALFIESSPTKPPPSWSQVVAHLRPLVPTRYIPALMYAVEGELPRLASGKLDRLALTSSHERLTRLP